MRRNQQGQEGLQIIPQGVPRPQTEERVETTSEEINISPGEEVKGSPD